MKFSQIILLLFIISICNVFLAMALQSGDITNLEDNFLGWFENENAANDMLANFRANVQKQDNWFLDKLIDSAQAFVEAVNVVTIGFEIVKLVLWANVSPFTSLVFSNSMAGGSVILRAIGSVGILYIQWFQVMLIVRLFKLWKGSDQ